MRQIVASTPEHLKLLCEELEYLPAPNLKGITLLSDGEPVIVVGYDCWTSGSVAMHQWIKHPRFLGRDILHEAFRYPFGIGKLQQVIAVVRSDNTKALELDHRLGFKIAAIIPDAYGPGVDMHIMNLSRHQCKWYSNGSP